MALPSAHFETYRLVVIRRPAASVTRQVQKLEAAGGWHSRHCCRTLRIGSSGRLHQGAPQSTNRPSHYKESGPPVKFTKPGSTPVGTLGAVTGDSAPGGAKQVRRFLLRTTQVQSRILNCTTLCHGYPCPSFPGWGQNITQRYKVVPPREGERRWRHWQRVSLHRVNGVGNAPQSRSRRHRRRRLNPTSDCGRLGSRQSGQSSPSRTPRRRSRRCRQRQRRAAWTW